MMAATPRSWSTPHAAATSPNARCRVRCGNIAVSLASVAAAMSAAVPRYRSEIIFGLPSTRPISRRYQYVFPPNLFGYKLAMIRSYTMMKTGSTTGTVCHQGKRIKPDHGPTPEDHDPRKLPLAIPGHHTGPLHAPRAVRADVPRELDTVVQRSMAADPAGRYPNAQAMAAALARPAAQADRGPGSHIPAELGPAQPADAPAEPGFLHHEGRWLGWTLALIGMAAVVALVGVALSRSTDLDLHLPGNPTQTPTTPPASTISAATTPTRFTQALAFDPLGDGHENDDQAPRAIDQDAATAWTTQHYNRPALGGLKPGVGLVLDAGHPVAADELDLTLLSAGGSLEVYAAPDNADRAPTSFPDGWTRLATAPAITSPQQRLTLSGAGSFRWYLVWFTSLPPAPDDPSHYQNGIAEALLGPQS